VTQNIDSLEDSRVEALKTAISKHAQRQVPRKGSISEYFDLPSEERESTLAIYNIIKEDAS
jgi:hypothetical protein